MHEPLSPWLITISAVTLIAALTIGVFRTKGRKLPPGPPGDPIIGQIRHMPATHRHAYFTELNRTYGDIVHISVLGAPIIILGSYETAHELLAKRGRIYASRPQTTFMDDVLNLKHHIATEVYGSIWREERRLYNSHIGKEAVRTQYRPDIEEQAQSYVLRSLLENESSATDYESVLYKTFLKVVYGLQITSDDDKTLKSSRRGTAIASASLLPAKYLVNTFPSLLYVPTWFPGAEWKRNGLAWRKIIQSMMQEPFDTVKKAESEGTAIPSFTLSMIRDAGTLDEPTKVVTSSSIFQAGIETTTATVRWFTYAMLTHPEIQRRAQEEIDSVVGTDRLPTIADHLSLPYLDAIMKEVFRWRPVLPLSTPHKSTQDDIYNGYFIPKGSVVLQNSWAMAMNEKLHPNPEQFSPERYLVPNPPMDPQLYLFGIGRRTCPGVPFAANVILAVMLTLLATVDIVPVCDADGNEVIPKVETTGMIVNAPLPFEYKLKPRSDAAFTLLRDAVALKA